MLHICPEEAEGTIESPNSFIIWYKMTAECNFIHDAENIPYSVGSEHVLSVPQSSIVVRKLLTTHQWVTTLHRLTCLFSSICSCAAVYFESISHKLSCCRKYSLEDFSFFFTNACIVFDWAFIKDKMICDTFFKGFQGERITTEKFEVGKYWETD